MPGRGQRGVWGHSEMKEKRRVASHVHMPVTLVLIKMLSSAQIFAWLVICQGNSSDDNLLIAIRKSTNFYIASLSKCKFPEMATSMKASFFNSLFMKGSINHAV